MGIPRSIDDIQPFAELAQNATTSVYKAYQASLERFVLLKRLRPAVSTDSDLAARFQEEARIAAKIQHPNVVSIYAFGSDDEGAYIIAEYVDGLDLAELIARSRIPADIALFILEKSARGLKAAHDKDVLHRDLKPSNILISRAGEVKLSDFGLATATGGSSTDCSEVRGTLAYLAPEQILESEADERSDLFALGATFFEMLTGRRAYPGATPQELFDAILHRDPVPYLAATPGVDEDIAEICSRLLARDPSDRFPDAGRLVEAVASCRRGRRASVGAAVLSRFLDAPESFEPPVEEAASNHAVPTVTIVPSDAPAVRPETFGRRRWKAAGAAAGVLFFAVALVYAGVSFFRLPTALQHSTTFPMRGIADSILIDSALAAGAAGTAEPDQLRLDSIAAAAEVATEEVAARPRRTVPEPEEHLSEEEAEEQAGFILITIDTMATVYVGSDSAGTVRRGEPLAVGAPPGEHRVTFRNTAFPLEVRTVSVRSTDTTRLDVSLWSTVGRLELQVSPWANVYVDGRPVGQTPLREPLVLLPGVRILRLENPEMGVDYTTNVRIPKGDLVSRSFILSNLQ